MTDALTPSRDIARLIEIMAALRTPVTGCPWDLEQTFETIAPYTIEEAYEVADAIGRGDLIDLKDELGDLLLHRTDRQLRAELLHRAVEQRREHRREQRVGACPVLGYVAPHCCDAVRESAESRRCAATSA